MLCHFSMFLFYFISMLLFSSMQFFCILKCACRINKNQIRLYFCNPERVNDSTLTIEKMSTHNYRDIYSFLYSNISELVLIKIGSTWVDDTIYLFFLPPLAFVALIMQMLAFIVFLRIGTSASHNHFLYYYLRANTLISTFECALVVFEMFAYSPRYIRFATLSMFTRVYQCFMVNYIGTTLCVVVNILDLFVLLERLANFNVKWKRLLRFSPLTNLLITIVACSIINLPFYFYRVVISDEQLYTNLVNIQPNSTYILCDRASFISSSLGNVLTIFSALLKDVCTFVLEIYGCIQLVVYFRRFFSFKIGQQHGDVRPSKYDKNRQHRKITLMVIVFSMFSIQTHAAMIFLFFGFFLKLNIPHEQTIVMLVLTLKPLSNFFVFYYFDNNFKIACKKPFRKHHFVSSASRL